MCLLFDSRLLCAEADKKKIAELEAKLEKMQIAKKKRRSKWAEVHEEVCNAVNPLLPSIKELDYNSLFWLSHYVARYKNRLAEKNPDVVAAYKCYKVWYYETKKATDFDTGEVSEDDEAGAAESDDNED